MHIVLNALQKISGVIEVSKSLTVASPTVDQENGRKAKILCHEDQGELGKGGLEVKLCVLRILKISTV